MAFPDRISLEAVFWVPN